VLAAAAAAVGPLQDLLLLPPPTAALCVITLTAASRTAVLQQLLRVLQREAFDVAAASSSVLSAELAAALLLPGELVDTGVVLLQLLRPSAGAWLPHLLQSSGEQAGRLLESVLDISTVSRTARLASAWWTLTMPCSDRNAYGKVVPFCKAQHWCIVYAFCR
jgi:hypothetical protein